MDFEFLKNEFILSAISGVTKQQLVRIYKDEYECTDEDIDNILTSSNFNKKPRFINYFDFYNLKIPASAKRLKFPFTQIYIQPGFLSKSECQEIMTEVDKDLHPSAVSNPEDRILVSDYRTSSSCFFDYHSGKTGFEIDKKINRYLGIDPFIGETVQAQKYEPGQYYKEHHDYYDPFSEEYKTYTEWMGQRTWTFMVYLNDVEEGGETYFKHLNMKVKPQTGLAIFWNNLWPFGWPNYKTLHEALPPISGNKYILTKWYRSWPLL